MITLLNKFDDNYVIKKEDVYDIVAAYIKENSLEEYLRDINFDPLNKYIAHYNTRTNEIVFSDEKIIESGYDLFDKLQKCFQIDENYYTYFLNFYYLYVIYHELTHVSQKARYEKNIAKKDDLFNYLYELCLDLRKTDMAFYNMNHDMFPMEKEANNKGYLQAYNLMNYTKLPSYECKIMYLKYLNCLLANYKMISDSIIISPTETLIAEKKDCVKRLNELVENSKLSKIERMNLGVSITPKEYNSINKKILLKR